MNNALLKNGYIEYAKFVWYTNNLFVIGTLSTSMEIAFHGVLHNLIMGVVELLNHIVNNIGSIIFG
ncbi:MAG: hypothetical protein WDA24_03410 [Tissierellales bacterium]